MFKFALCLLLLVELVSGFQPRSAFLSARHQISKTSLNEIPLELSGQLDPSKVWDVTLEFNGVQKVVSISEGNSILEIAETIFDGTTALFLNVCRLENTHQSRFHWSKWLILNFAALEDVTDIRSILITSWVGVDSSCRNGVCTTCAGKVSQYISVETNSSPVFLTLFYELGDGEYWKYQNGRELSWQASNRCRVCVHVSVLCLRSRGRHQAGPNG